MNDESRQSKGGRARAEKLTSEERQSIASTAARARWSHDAELPRATHTGDLEIGSAVIPCAVLADGRRVLSETGIATAIGSRSGASKRLKQRATESGAQVPVFLAPSQIRPFISEEVLNGPLKPIFYKNGRRTVVGYSADALPSICEIWLAAREASVLQQQQMERALKAEVLMRSLAKVGIVALVDEATGYQVERERNALHELLSKYLTEERLAWAKRFPDEFYKQIYRLQGWIWPSGSGRPGYVGKLTNKLVYEKLPKGVLDELQKRNPTIISGRRRHKHHQFLSEDIGQPDLQNHLLQLIAVMRASPDWAHFIDNFERAFPGAQGRLDF